MPIRFDLTYAYPTWFFIVLCSCAVLFVLGMTDFFGGFRPRFITAIPPVALLIGIASVISVFATQDHETELRLSDAIEKHYDLVVENYTDSSDLNDSSSTDKYFVAHETTKTPHDSMNCFINSSKHYDVGLSLGPKFDGSVYCDTKHTNTFTLINPTWTDIKHTK